MVMYYPHSINLGGGKALVVCLLVWLVSLVVRG